MLYFVVVVSWVRECWDISQLPVLNISVLLKEALVFL